MRARVAIYKEFTGRFGNNMFQYAYARSLSDRTGIELVTSRWAGEDFFQLPDHRPTGNDMHFTLPEEYNQDQGSLIYTRAQARLWFQFKPEVQARLNTIHTPEFVTYRRVGDYPSIGYPTVSRASYERAFKKFGMYGQKEYALDRDDNPDFIVDFWQQMKAKVFFRGNSSFSWWAATLGEGKVYSPVINHHNAGDHDFQFVEGNHPKLSILPMCSDLHLREA